MRTLLMSAYFADIFVDRRMTATLSDGITDDGVREADSNYMGCY
jgi:hypothetical protein